MCVNINEDWKERVEQGYFYTFVVRASKGAQGKRLRGDPHCLTVQLVTKHSVHTSFQFIVLVTPIFVCSRSLQDGTL